mgnify:CR=1 FL=1|jgi:hypothetical protein
MISLELFREVAGQARRQRMTLDEMGQALGCSRQYVRQLYVRAGITYWKAERPGPAPKVKGACSGCGEPRYWRGPSVTGLCRKCAARRKEAS